MTLAILGLLATVNPAAAGLAMATDRRTNRPVPVAAGAGISLLLFLIAAIGAKGLLGVLDVTVGTYRLGAGIVIVTAGLRWAMVGPAAPVEEPDNDRLLVGFVAFPALITPGALALAISIGAGDAGVGPVFVGGLLAFGAAAGCILARRSIPQPYAVSAVRFFGAVAVIVGVMVAVDGIKTL